MRAFYCVAAASWDAAPAADAIAVSRTAELVNVLSPADPHPALEALGALRLGATLAELAPADRAHFTNSLVRRDGDEMEVPSTDVRVTDVDLGMPPTPRIVFAGDDPEAY
jgi:hypothetical protein